MMSLWRDQKSPQNSARQARTLLPQIAGRKTCPPEPPFQTMSFKTPSRSYFAQVCKTLLLHALLVLIRKRLHTSLRRIRTKSVGLTLPKWQV